MKIKKGFLLRSLDQEHIVVAIGEASMEFNGMIRLNNTGVLYWKELEKGCTKEDLVSVTLEHYAEADAETVRRDVEEFLDTISIAIDNDVSED